jgi:hypothetical protein
MVGTNLLRELKLKKCLPSELRKSSQDDVSYSETRPAWLDWAGPLKNHDCEVLPRDPK